MRESEPSGGRARRILGIRYVYPYGYRYIAIVSLREKKRPQYTFEERDPCTVEDIESASQLLP